MQCIKKGSTLRVSAKKDRPQPRIVFRFGRQKDRIADYLKFRKLVKNVVAKLLSGNTSLSTKRSRMGTRTTKARITARISTYLLL